MTLICIVIIVIPIMRYRYQLNYLNIILFLSHNCYQFSSIILINCLRLNFLLKIKISLLLLSAQELTNLFLKIALNFMSVLL